jgi:hypothetical protein
MEVEHQRLLEGIGLHHDRAWVLQFLDDPAIEPTIHPGGSSVVAAVVSMVDSTTTLGPHGGQMRLALRFRSPSAADISFQRAIVVASRGQ